MFLQLLLILLPIAALSGWYFGFKSRHDSLLKSEKENTIPQDYFLGLNYLINEQPDKAVDVFIKVLEVNSDTVEMHLALGSLFRRQGEVERAIRIHQNLIARPQLEKEQRIKALFELGQDYLHAGVLDRAERLFLELLEINDEDLMTYKCLLNIYEKQKDWRQAITVAKKLVGASEGRSWTPLAYYYCELVEETLNQGLIDEAQVYLKKALIYDKNCVRASILLGKLEFNAGQYKHALRYYKQVKDQDADFISEAAPYLINCYEQLDKTDDGLQYLNACFDEHPTALLALFLAKNIENIMVMKKPPNLLLNKASVVLHCEF